MGNNIKIEPGSGSLLHTSDVPVSRHMRRYFTGGLANLALWYERSRQRHQLAKLDHRMLRDIGLSPADVERERRKLPWQR